MNNPKDGKLVWWKMLIFLASIISLGYGVILVTNLNLNTPQELKFSVKEINIKDIIFDCGITQLEGKVSSKDFLVNSPIHVTMIVNPSINETTKILSIFVPFTNEKIPADKISKVESFYSNQSIILEEVANSTIFKGEGEIILSKPDKYSILILEYDINSKMSCYSFSHEQFSIITDDDLLQIKSAKEVIRNGIIMEALSWIIVGATGVMFLAQVGLKDE